jgi:hypothetical protein
MRKDEYEKAGVESLISESTIANGMLRANAFNSFCGKDSQLFLGEK